MGISGEVAGKPGGAALAEHLRKVENSRPDAARQIGERWRRAATATDSAGGEIARAVSALDGAWEGASADAFVGYMGKVSKGFREVHAAVDAAVAVIDGVAQAVEAVKNAATAIGERALADARKAEQAYAQAVSEHGGDPEAERMAAQVRDDAVERAMSQHASEAGTRIAEANETLNGALG